MPQDKKRRKAKLVKGGAPGLKRQAKAIAKNKGVRAVASAIPPGIHVAKPKSIPKRRKRPSTAIGRAAGIAAAKAKRSIRQTFGASKPAAKHTSAVARKISQQLNAPNAGFNKGDINTTRRAIADAQRGVRKTRQRGM